ncbi:MAG: hypothetical protein U9Q58_03175 [Pseudomonadota bacterium]|nr:hypothetical protein [Pseudomonadota bacterium]
MLILLPLLCGSATVKAQNPFLSPKSAPKNFQQDRQLLAPQNSFLSKITFRQLQLKEKMTVLVRQVKTTESIAPWLTVLLIAFGYGALHAAGPGHGKAVALSFISSRKASLGSGLLFASMIAFCHGFSGIICVLGIYYFLEGGISGSLGTVSHITQTVSYSLIALLGFGIFVKNSHSLLFKAKLKPKLEADSGALGTPANDVKESKWAFVLWAVTVGVVPCPGVIMVLLFCLSLNMLGLGLWLAVFISLGMATTISLVVVSVVFGRGLSLRNVSEKRIVTVEKVFGVVSGMAITALGLLFLSMI